MKLKEIKIISYELRKCVGEAKDFFKGNAYI